MSFKNFFEKADREGLPVGDRGPIVPLQKWEAEGGEFWGEFMVARDGRLRRSCIDPHFEFKAALVGIQLERLRQCEICERFFYAVPIDRKTCSKKCNNTRRVKEWRAKQAKHEYNRKLRSAGALPPSKRKRR